MKSVSAQTRRPVLSRETIGRAIDGRPIRLHCAGLGRLAGRRYAVICSVGRRAGRVRRAAVIALREDPSTGEVLVVAGTRDAHRYRDHPREARIQASFFGWPWPGSLAASLGGVSFAPALRSGMRDA